MVISLQLVEVLFWGFWTFIKEWAILSFLPFTVALQAIPLNSMPLLLATMEIVRQLVLNQYFKVLFPFIFFAVDKFNYWPTPKQAIKFLLTAPIVLFVAPYVFTLLVIAGLHPIIIPIASAFFSFITFFAMTTILALSFLFDFLKQNGAYHIKNTFKNPLSHESFLLVFIAAGVSFSIKSSMPFFVTGGAILSGYVITQIPKFLSYLFSVHQPIIFTTSDNNLVANHTIPIQRNNPPPLLPRNNHASRIPNLANEQDRIRQQQSNFLSSLNQQQEIRQRPYFSPFQKVLDLLKDVKNDYLLTENNNFFLRDAAEKNNWDLVVRLLKRPNVATQAHCDDWIVLRLAIQHDQWKVVSKFLKLPLLIHTPMTPEKNEALNRLIHKVQTQNRTDLINQIVHCPTYDLFTVQAKFNFLLFSIKHNIYSAVIKSLNDDDLLNALELDSVKVIFGEMSDDQIVKISDQCNSFLVSLKNIMINSKVTINKLSIAHIINIDTFDSIKSVDFFLKNPLKFLESKTDNIPHIMIAMHLLHSKNNYLRLISTRQNAREGAQQASEVIMANQLFEIVKDHYLSDFKAKSAERYSSVEIIEREIKTYLLEQIISEAHENIKNQKDIKGSNKIIKIIDSHKEDLLDDEIEAHMIFIRAMNKYFIPDNVSAAQTAWLSYSALHDIDRNNWKFLVQPTEEAIVHSTAESAQVANQTMTNIMASDIIRERIAYYWLAVTDKNYPDEDNFRLGNFVGAISTIYKTYGFGQSSCYPGHLTAIAQMGLNHPIAEPTTLDTLIDQAIVAPVIEIIKNIFEHNHPHWSAEDKETFLTSITYINNENADKLFHSNEASPIDIKMYNIFNNNYPYIIESAFDQIFKNQRYRNRQVSLQEREEIKHGIEYKLRAMASNQYITSTINDIILASSCIRKDINLKEASPFVPNTPKHRLYLALAERLDAKLLSLPKKELPSIRDLNKIGSELSIQIINDIMADRTPTIALEALEKFGIYLNTGDIEDLKMIHKKECSVLPVLPQFNANRAATRTQHVAQNPAPHNEPTIQPPTL